MSTLRMPRSQAAKLGIGRKRGKRKAVIGQPASRALFIAACDAHGIPVPEPEFKFHRDRGWKFDWCWIEHNIALEIDGGAWTRGRHTRGRGFINDQEKRNEAMLLGWRVYHCTPQDVQSGAVFKLLRRAFGLEA